MAKRRQRIPKLTFTAWRKLGWHVTYRDPNTGTPRKHRFGILQRDREAEARVLYHAWVLEHLGGNGEAAHPTKVKPATKRKANPKMLTGSLLDIASTLIQSERSRVRNDGEPRRRGTIAPAVFIDRRKQIRDFLDFLNARYGTGAVAKLQIADLTG